VGQRVPQPGLLRRKLSVGHLGKRRRAAWSCSKRWSCRSSIDRLKAVQFCFRLLDIVKKEIFALTQRCDVLLDFRLPGSPPVELDLLVLRVDSLKPECLLSRTLHCSTHPSRDTAEQQRLISQLVLVVYRAGEGNVQITGATWQLTSSWAIATSFSVRTSWPDPYRRPWLGHQSCRKPVDQVKSAGVMQNSTQEFLNVQSPLYCYNRSKQHHQLSLSASYNALNTTASKIDIKGSIHPQTVLVYV